MSDPTVRIAKKATTLSGGLARFRTASHDVVWALIVSTWVDTLDECCNPPCDQQADIRHSFLVNGDILNLLVCYDCALQVALDCGMVRSEAEFAVRSP